MKTVISLSAREQDKTSATNSKRRDQSEQKIASIDKRIADIDAQIASLKKREA
jgi:ABC-type Fe3+-hydroxamate transport system substrate-binding protein